MTEEMQSNRQQTSFDFLVFSRYLLFLPSSSFSDKVRAELRLSCDVMLCEDGAMPSYLYVRSIRYKGNVIVAQRIVGHRLVCVMILLSCHYPKKPQDCVTRD